MKYDLEVLTFSTDCTTHDKGNLEWQESLQTPGPHACYGSPPHKALHH